MSKLKKVLSVFLAALMAFSVCSVATFAEDADYTDDLIAASTNSDERVATIILPGIGQSESSYITENGTEVSGGLILIDTDGLVGTILTKLAWPLLSSIFTQKVHSRLGKAVSEVVADLFYIQTSDKEGNAKENLVLKEFPDPLSQYNEDDHGWFYRMFPMEPVVEAMQETYGAEDETYNPEDYIYLYTFQLIGNPYDSAKGLVDYIEMVKEKSNVDKVNLVPISLGGTIMTAYMQLIQDEYNGDFSNINKIINIVACLNGTELFTDFFQREWNLADEFLYDEYIDLIVEANDMDAYLGSLIKIALRIIPKDALYAILTGAMDALLENMLTSCPQFWAMLTADSYDDLADRYLSGAESATLRAKTDWFQKARVNLVANLKDAKANYDITTYSVAAYGLQFTDGEYNFFGIVDSSATTNSDGIINVNSASMGATYVIPGETLGYAGDYVSPDGQIDASTCAFPETTWFYGNQHHEVGRCDVILKLLGQIITNQVADVNSSENYPQFNYGRVTRNLTRDGYLIDKAEEVIANVDGIYTEEQIATVKPVYEKAVALLDQKILTVNSAAEAEAMITELNDALACTGLTSVDKGPDFMTKVLNAVLGVAERIICR